jgi:3-oxosteroid 1-dehydrogenase
MPGWPSETSGTGYAYGPDYAMPHAIMVNRAGVRFCDDSYWVDVVQKIYAAKESNLPFFLVWDEQHHRKYGLGATPPGDDYPAGLVESAPSLGELAGLLGVDATQLQSTVTRFNAGAAQGKDTEFGRGTVDYIRRFAGDPKNTPNPVLGTLSQAPFHGMRLLLVACGIGASGISADSRGRVLHPGGAVLEGLYAVGSCAAMTTTGGGYNSGYALGRGITLAYVVSAELAGRPVQAATT